MRILTKADVRQAAGRGIICGFDGTSVSPELRELLREVRPLGVILFARNVESPEQTRELIRELKSFRPEEPLLVCVDQEGGRVARLRQGVTVWPPMRDVGRCGDAKLAQRVGLAIGREMRAVGFDVDFAPVLDVDTNPKNPIIGDRSFSDQAEVVATLGAAFIRGMQAAGVAACGKHFPGHGDTELDSHLALPTVEHELGRLREVEWRPFAAAVTAGVSSIMTAHVMMPALDEQLPATLSPRALGVLRRELGFAGIIVSDDLEMKAVFDRFSIADMARLGLTAGIDVFLACKRPEVVLELLRRLIHLGEDERADHEAILRRDRRLLAWRDAYFRPVGPATELRQWLACAEHLDLVSHVAERVARG